MNQDLRVQSGGVLERVITMPVYRIQDLSGVGDRAIISFDAKIGYLVEQNLRAHAEHGDVELTCVSAFAWSGRLDGQLTNRNVIDDVRRWCHQHSVTAASTLKVLMVASQTVIPVVLSGHGSDVQECYFGKKSYMRVPKDWSFNRASLEARLAYENGQRKVYPEDHGAPFREEKRAIETVWRSDWTEDQCAAARQAYIDAHITPIYHNAPPDVPVLPDPSTT